ncbi:hypothetical protein C3L33_08517, partial [Rhododendron williamsianum]
MELDPDDIFRDEDDDPENEFYQEREASKEMVVYLVDASPKMFSATALQSLKTQIINRSYDEVAICFFNTREKKNLQDLNCVYVFNVAERDDLDRPTARLIKDFDCIEESFTKEIGSQCGILSGSRDNSLYNALWVAQALLRKGSAKTADKRILLFTNEDDPFGSIKGVVKIDMTRTTLQRAKVTIRCVYKFNYTLEVNVRVRLIASYCALFQDAQDLGISIELLPLSRPDEEFNISLFYSDLLGLEGDDASQFLPLAGERCLIHQNFYFTDFVCSIFSEDIKFSVEELSEIKRVSTGHLRLLGFKPLSCLKDYHNLRPSTFLFPSDEVVLLLLAFLLLEVVGSTCIFIALHRSMLRLNRYAVAFYGSATHPQLVALVAQDEIVTASGQIHTDENNETPRANDDQIRKATALMRRVDLKDFSVCQFSNPALQRHYAVLQALALDEDEMPEVKDETAPDEEGMARTGVVNALEEFKLSVYGENYDEDKEFETNGKVSEASRKRKAIAENAVKECTNYDWSDLADNGKVTFSGFVLKNSDELFLACGKDILNKLKDLTTVELKYYLTAQAFPLLGEKRL